MYSKVIFLLMDINTIKLCMSPTTSNLPIVQTAKHHCFPCEVIVIVHRPFATYRYQPAINERKPPTICVIALHKLTYCITLF